ncbi:EpsG family protein [Motiliproteus sp. SC1-56]|uniref:EpsG family protein n=1 Tax=Motiliproteus sp. SC1-56 TaxID=2799565 RepID=UPI001A900DA2|nr:EpsG family protein [Motiliproteus sp. SC1-56]
MSHDLYILCSFFITLILLFLGVASAYGRKEIELLNLIFVFAYVVFIGLRDNSLGIDTITYGKIFSTLDFDYYPLDIDPLFKGLIYFVRLFTEDQIIFFIVCYVIMNANIIIFFRSFDKRLYLVFYSVFSITFLYYNLHMNILRQGLSISFGLLYISSLYRGNLKTSFVFLFLASLFHAASAILLVCFVDRVLFRKVRIGRLSVAALCCCVVFWVYNPIVNLSSILAPYHFAFDKLYRYTSWEYSTPFSFKIQYVLTLCAFFAACWYKYRGGKNGFSGDPVIDICVRVLIIGFLSLFLFSFDQMVADRVFYIFFFFVVVICVKLFFVWFKVDRFSVVLGVTAFLMFSLKTFYIQFPNWFVYKTYMNGVL